MLTEEDFFRLDLLMVYDGEIKTKLINQNAFYVYVIKTDNKYYVGLTKHLSQRIREHKRSNTNNILWKKGVVYILEELETETQMILLEQIWIVWFKINFNCVNDKIITSRIKRGWTTFINCHNTNYKSLIENETIQGIKLLDKENKNWSNLPSDAIFFECDRLSAY